MTVTADPFEDEADEFSRVCATFEEKGGLEEIIRSTILCVVRHP